MCTKPDRANPRHCHRAPAAHRTPSPQPFYPHSSAGPAMLFPLRTLATLVFTAPTFSLASAAWPTGTLTKHPHASDDGDQDRVIVVRLGQPSAGPASHRPNVNPP